MYAMPLSQPSISVPPIFTSASAVAFTSLVRNETCSSDPSPYFLLEILPPVVRTADRLQEVKLCTWQEYIRRAYDRDPVVGAGGRPPHIRDLVHRCVISLQRSVPGLDPEFPICLPGWPLYTPEGRRAHDGILVIQPPAGHGISHSPPMSSAKGTVKLTKTGRDDPGMAQFPSLFSRHTSPHPRCGTSAF